MIATPKVTPGLKWEPETRFVRCIAEYRPAAMTSGAFLYPKFWAMVSIVVPMISNMAKMTRSLLLLTSLVYASIDL